MTEEQENIMREFEEYKFLVRENPCGMSAAEFASLAKTMHCVKDMFGVFNYTTLEHTLHTHQRTLRRLVNKGELEAPKRHGNISLSFSVGSVMDFLRRKGLLKE